MSGLACCHRLPLTHPVIFEGQIQSDSQFFLDKRGIIWTQIQSMALGGGGGCGGFNSARTVLNRRGGALLSAEKKAAVNHPHPPIPACFRLCSVRVLPLTELPSAPPGSAMAGMDGLIGAEERIINRNPNMGENVVSTSCTSSSSILLLSAPVFDLTLREAFLLPIVMIEHTQRFQVTLFKSFPPDYYCNYVVMVTADSLCLHACVFGHLPPCSLAAHSPAFRSPHLVRCAFHAHASSVCVSSSTCICRFC